MTQNRGRKVRFDDPNTTWFDMVLNSDDHEPGNEKVFLAAFVLTLFLNATGAMIATFKGATLPSLLAVNAVVMGLLLVSVYILADLYFRLLVVKAGSTQVAPLYVWAAICGECYVSLGLTAVLALIWRLYLSPTPLILPF